MWQWIIAILGSTIGVGKLVSIVFFILLILSRIARTNNKEELLSENYKKKYEEARRRNIKTFIIWGMITLAIVAGILFFSLHK